MDQLVINFNEVKTVICFQDFVRIVCQCVCMHVHVYSNSGNFQTSQRCWWH